MKKIMALILALTMTIVFAGCGKKSEKEMTESVTLGVTPEDLESILRESDNDGAEFLLEMVDALGDFEYKYTNFGDDKVTLNSNGGVIQFLGLAERDSHKITELVICGKLCSTASEVVDEYNSLYTRMLVDYEVDSYAVILSSIFDISQEEGEKLINDGDASGDFKGKRYHIITKKSDDDIFTFITTFEDEEKLLEYMNSDKE